MPQIEDNFAPVGRHLPSLIVAIAGGVALRLLTGAGLITNWSFAIGLIVWTLAVVPNLPGLLTGEASPRQRGVALAWLVAAMCIATIPDWGTVLNASGWRLLVAIILIAVGGLSARAALDTTPRTPAESPDLVGIDRDFTPAEIVEAERVVGAL